METAFASLIAAMSGAFPIEIINNTRWGIIMFITRARPLAARVLKWVSLLSVVDCRLLTVVSVTNRLLDK